MPSGHIATSRHAVDSEEIFPRAVTRPTQPSYPADDFDADEPSHVDLAYIGWRRVLSYRLETVEDAERAIHEAFVYAWKLGGVVTLER